MLSSLSPARRRLFLGLAAVAALALVAGVVALVLNRPRAVTPVAQDAQPPVLIVPGYGGGEGGLDVLARALTRDGHDDVSIVHLAGDGTGDLNEQAKVLQSAVRAKVTAGAPSVDIVGYSAGGVIARLWVRSYDGGSVARRIVTLGSPQHGTDLAALAAGLAPDGCPVACRQLATDSDLLRSLNAGDETPAGPEWISIWTTDDQISTPPETASLAGALDFSVQSVCPSLHVTHGELPTTAEVDAMIAAQLRRTAPAALTTCPGA